MSSSQMPKVVNRIPGRMAVRCLLAAAAAIGALLLHFLLERSLGASFPPFMVFYPAIMAVALWAGWWAGLVSTAASALLTAYFVLEPRFSFAVANPAEATSLALFAAIGVFICWLAGGYRQSRERIAAYEKNFAVRQSEQQFRTRLTEKARLLELSYDAIFVWARNDRITYWNQGAREAYGYTMEEALGRTPHELLHTEFPQGLETILDEARQRGRWSGELVHTRKDGRKITVSSRWALDLDAQGKIAAILETCTDITERKRAEEALRESEEKFRALIEQASDAFMLHDDEGRFLEVNREACQSLGYTREELLRMHVSDVREAVGVNGAKKLWENAEPGKAYTFQAIHRRKDGTEFPVEARLSPYFIGEQRLHLGLIRDITERIQTQRKMNEDTERMDLALGVAKAAEWELDLDTGKAFQSPRHAKLFGYDRPQDDWSVESFLEHVAAEDRSLAREKLKECISTGSMDYEVRVRRTDGQLRWFWLAGRCRRDESGKPSRVLGIVLDVSDRKIVEQELQRLNEELEDRVRLRTAELETMNKEASAFSYSVSHDLRAPVRTMAGFSQALLEDYDGRLDEKGRHYLIRIQTAAQRMGDLIDALLSLSRLTRAEMEIKATDLSAIAQAVVNGLRDGDRSREVEVKIEPDMCVKGDPRLLHVALQNLISNAWKFTVNRERAAIEVGRLNDRPNPAFFVRDNGAGFDMQYANQLFTPFQRLHTEAEFAGTGIGLATVQRVILRHHGRIWAEAEEDRGATFFFELGLQT